MYNEKVRAALQSKEPHAAPRSGKQGTLAKDAGSTTIPVEESDATARTFSVVESDETWKTSIGDEGMSYNEFVQTPYVPKRSRSKARVYRSLPQPKSSTQRKKTTTRGQ
jgi:hypothetical protein